MKICLIILFTFSITLAFSQEVNRVINEGNEAYKKGDYKTASEFYKKALAKGNNVTAAFNLGNALDKQNDPLSAEKYYEAVSTSATDASLKAKGFYNKGVAQVQQQKLVDAIESFKHALMLNPEDDDARENLQKAINDLKKQQQNQPQPQKSKQKQQQQKNNKMPNPAIMEQKFNELRDKEKQLQKMLQQRPNNDQPEKDW